MATYLRNNDEISKYINIHNIGKPLFYIDDEVKLKHDSIEIYENGLEHVGYDDRTYRLMYEYLGKKLIIIEKFKGQPNDYPWWSRVRPLNNPYSEPVYLPDELLYDFNYNPSYKPKNIKRTLESINNDFNKVAIVVKNDEESEKVQKMLFENGYKWNGNGPFVKRINHFEYYPTVIFAYIDNMTMTKIEIEYDNPYYQEKLDELKSGKYDNTYYKLFDINDFYTYKNMIIYKTGTPSYKPKNIKRTLESFQEFSKDILYAFDFDDTLVYSDKFVDYIKPLLNENLTPLSLFNSELNKIDVDLSELKYEHGRIYFDDPDKNIVIPRNSTWVRKKDRVYLTTPESYYLTNESMPNKINEDIVKIYNNSDNVAIITARKETLRNKTLKTLNELNIKKPNYGLFMYPSNSFSFKSKWKAERLLELYDKGFKEINYFDDNIKLLKKIKHYLSKYKKNIYLYKVNNNKYRKI